MTYKKWCNWRLAALALPVALFSCSDDNETPVDDNQLASDTFPVEFGTHVANFDAEDDSEQSQFVSDEKIVVQHITSEEADAGDWSNAHTSVYTHANSKLTTETPDYWKTKDQVIVARAWKLAHSQNSTALPSSWAVQTDQSAGSEESDFIFATAKIDFDGDALLRFTHQTSLVNYRVNLAGTALPYVTVSKVTLGKEDLASRADFVAPSATQEKGSWTVTAANSTIIPNELEAPDGYVKAGSAIMIPQDIADKNFIVVTLSNGKELMWKPEASDRLETGRSYMFDVTVSADFSYLTVKKLDGVSWEDGGSQDIGSIGQQYDYGELKIGDYFYSDGSWSDGGFVRFNTSGNGSVEWASPKPGPTYTNPYTGESRYVIGVVFCTDQDRMGDAEKAAIKAKGLTPHGLVVCVKTLFNTQWDNSANDEAEIGVPNVRGSAGNPLYPYANAAISGYDVCRKVTQSRAAQIASGNYVAVKDLNALYAPDNSTGWFVPATGQWFDMLRNFTGLDFSDKADFYFISNEVEEDDGLHFDWQLDYSLSLIDKYKEDVVSLLNNPFSALAAVEKDEFKANENFITATFADAGNMYYTSVLPKFVTVRRASKSYWLNVRPMLAF